MNILRKKILLVGGLGHTDLSGKVPRPGLLMLRQAARAAGHDAEIANYSTSLMDELYPPQVVERIATMYHRSIKPIVMDGQNPWLNPLKFFRLISDLKSLKTIARELASIEKTVYERVGHEISRQVTTENLDAVGLSLYLGGSTIGSIIIADILRQDHPDLPIIFGGPQTTHFAETIYQETHAPTALVLGEGELALVKILNNLRKGTIANLDQIPNITYRTEDGKIIRTLRQRLPHQEWIKASCASYEEEDFSGVMRYAFIETSRGCTYKCHFCTQPLLSGSEIRYLKPAKNIVDEMITINEQFGIDHFEFVGSSTPQSQAEEIADELIKRGLKNKFKWVLFMRAVDDRSNAPSTQVLMNKIAGAGALSIFFGVEAADNATLKKMGKGSKIETIREAMKASVAAGIQTIGSFIYPYPGMPANEADLIINFLKEVMPLSAPAQALGLLPGTYDADNAEQIGCEIVYPDPADRQAYLAGEKAKPTITSPEILRYLLTYPLILSLPMKFWSELPYKINGLTYQQYISAANKLTNRISRLGILTGFSHSHALIADTMKVTPEELSERMFYCALSGDPKETRKQINLFNVSSNHNCQQPHNI